MLARREDTYASFAAMMRQDRKIEQGLEDRLAVAGFQNIVAANDEPVRLGSKKFGGPGQDIVLQSG